MKFFKDHEKMCFYCDKFNNCARINKVSNCFEIDRSILNNRDINNFLRIKHEERKF